jgi:hypothetical protein
MGQTLETALWLEILKQAERMNLVAMMNSSIKHDAQYRSELQRLRDQAGTP